jgi:hypothetical protein
MPLDLRHDPPGFLPALRLIAETGVIAAHLVRRSPDRALEQVSDLVLQDGTCRQPEAHRHVSQTSLSSDKSALLPARLVRNHARARLAPSPHELLGYRRPRQSPQRGADSPARTAAPQDSHRYAGRPIKTSRRSRTHPRFGFDPPALDIDEPSPDTIGALHAAQNEQQFRKAIDGIKDAIPRRLLIDGQNPLTLLHATLSNCIIAAMRFA